MLIHETLTPIKGLELWKSDLLELGYILGDGGYSRVIVYNGYQALKLTCCRQTQKLFEALAPLDKAQYPAGLPAVFEQWGAVATDADGKVFKGYLIERLFKPDEVAERYHGRRHGRDILARHKQSPTLPHQRQGAGDVAALTEHVTAAHDRCVLGIRKVSVEHLEMADQLAVMRLPYRLESAFAFLAKFLRTSGGELDLLRAENIMLDIHGAPVLADPVAEQTAEPVKAPVSSKKVLYALAARVVVAVKGLNAETVWDTFAVSEDRAALLEQVADPQSLPRSILETKVVRHASAEHKVLINKGLELVATWLLPKKIVRQALYST